MASQTHCNKTCTCCHKIYDHKKSLDYLESKLKNISAHLIDTLREIKNDCERIDFIKKFMDQICPLSGEDLVKFLAVFSNDDTRMEFVKLIGTYDASFTVFNILRCLLRFSNDGARINFMKSIELEYNELLDDKLLDDEEFGCFLGVFSTDHGRNSFVKLFKNMFNLIYLGDVLSYLRIYNNENQIHTFIQIIKDRVIIDSNGIELIKSIKCYTDEHKYFLVLLENQNLDDKKQDIQKKLDDGNKTSLKKKSTKDWTFKIKKTVMNHSQDQDQDQNVMVKNVIDSSKDTSSDISSIES
jgi:hypothetical protein